MVKSRHMSLLHIVIWLNHFFFTGFEFWDWRSRRRRRSHRSIPGVLFLSSANQKEVQFFSSANQKGVHFVGGRCTTRPELQAKSAANVRQRPARRTYIGSVFNQRHLLSIKRCFLIHPVFKFTFPTCSTSSRRANRRKNEAQRQSLLSTRSPSFKIALFLWTLTYRCCYLDIFVKSLILNADILPWVLSFWLGERLEFSSEMFRRCQRCHAYKLQ